MTAHGRAGACSGADRTFSMIRERGDQHAHKIAGCAKSRTASIAEMGGVIRDVGRRTGGVIEFDQVRAVTDQAQDKEVRSAQVDVTGGWVTNALDRFTPGFSCLRRDYIQYFTPAKYMLWSGLCVCVCVCLPRTPITAAIAHRAVAALPGRHRRLAHRLCCEPLT